MLTWHTGLPTEPGWYWFRNLTFGEYARIIEVRNYAGRLAVGNSVIEGWTYMENGEWAGPIEQPNDL